MTEDDKRELARRARAPRVRVEVERHNQHNAVRPRAQDIRRMWKQMKASNPAEATPERLLALTNRLIHDEARRHDAEPEYYSPAQVEEILAPRQFVENDPLFKLARQPRRGESERAAQHLKRLLEAEQNGFKEREERDKVFGVDAKDKKTALSRAPRKTRIRKAPVPIKADAEEFG